MKNVLLVDDDLIFNFLSTKMLERMGFIGHIDTALNGQQALKLFNDYFIKIKVLPDIILLDLNMPIMDGFEFIEAFRNLNLPGKDKVRIIIVSSSQNPDDMARARQLGVIQYLDKPLNEETLRKALDADLGTHLTAA